MAVENTSWIIPAAKEAYKHRKEILSVWERITTLLRGKKKSIAFTGKAGVGKTVLYDYLSGKAYKQGYTPPLTSQAVESGKVSSPGKRIYISVIPGQESPPRMEAIDKIFSGKDPVDGIIHVVANGFIEIRNPTAREVLVKEGKLTTLNQYRNHQLKSEIESLDSTCGLIRQAIHKHRKPSWMLIAVAKVDLYSENIQEAENYYSPHGDSKFVERLRQLQSQVGTDNFSWDAVPVCAWLEDFEWNEEKRSSTLKPNQRDRLLAAFSKQLEQYCE